MMFGKMAAMLAGWVEMKLGNKIGNESTESFLSNTAMRLVSFFSKIYQRLNPSFSNGGYVDKFYQTVLDYHTKYPKNILVMGHTHDAGIISDWYCNSGSWQKGDPHFIVINKDGQVMLRKWPSCEQVFNQLVKG
jgi:UDP-2,3-diacylglucosamine pyrophosphatase LpxH